MKIIISNSSQVPIYEQIIKQIKTLISSGDLKDGDILPSVRAMAKELKISALTVKKAYDALEREGLAVTVQGKGSFISSKGVTMLAEEARREVELAMERAVQMGRRAGMDDGELIGLLKLILEENICL